MVAKTLPLDSQLACILFLGQAWRGRLWQRALSLSLSYYVFLATNIVHVFAKSLK